MHHWPETRTPVTTTVSLHDLSTAQGLHDSPTTFSSSGFANRLAGIIASQLSSNDSGCLVTTSHIEMSASMIELRAKTIAASYFQSGYIRARYS